MSALLVVLAFVQEPGRLVFDTKLDLQVAPGQFLSRATAMWDPLGAFGQLQNQAYGYLFPMGPFFAGGELLRVPGWVVERLWIATLLVTAYAGFVVLTRRLGIGTTPSRVVAAMAYAIGPRVIAELGPVSPIVQAGALLPWVLVPLVDGLRGAPPRRCAARSALAVLLMGGVNAALSLVLLPLPLLLLWLRRAPRSLTRWWVTAVALASIWWVVPLLLLGRYSPRFLDWIETASGTTSTNGTADTLRGAEDWVPRLLIAGRPWWRAGYDVASSPWLVLAAGVPVVLGLVGLTAAGRRSMPFRQVFLGALLLGLAVVTFGHAGLVSAPWHGMAQQLLDGSLAPLRNLQKFDPLVRLPLLLGAAHLLGRVRGASLRQGLVLLLATATTVTAVPALMGHVYPEGSATAIPAWWRQTASYLAHQGDGGRALLVPGSGFAEYTWGRTIDEPMQPLARSPWAVRNLVPLAGTGTVRAMDAVEQVLSDGRPSAGLAPYLARMGVTHLVLRSDLDWIRTGSSSPGAVRATLMASPGLHRVATFGPPVAPRRGGGTAVVGHGLEAGLRSVEIYEVTAGRPSLVVAAPLSGVITLAGGPESVLDALTAGVIGPDDPVLLAGQEQVLDPARRRNLVTDGLRRRERDLGRAVEGGSSTLTADDPFRVHRRVHDRLPDGIDSPATVARYSGIADVQASSSASDANALVYQSPSHQPFAAVDGDPGTEWLSAGSRGPVDEWLELRFDDRVDPTGLTVAMADNFLIGSRVTRVSVRTERGVRSTALRAGERPQPLDVAPGTTKVLRLTVAATADAGKARGLAGIIDLAVRGIYPERTLVTPPATSANSDYLLTRVPGARAACTLSGGRAVCDPGRWRQGEESRGIDRTVTVPTTQHLEVTGTVLPKAGPALDVLLEPLDSVEVSATSTYLPDPVARPRAAMDGDLGTAWIAGVGDPDPRIQLRWGRMAILDRLTVRFADGLVASRPTSLQVSSRQGVRSATIDRDGQAHFAALRTDAVTLRFPTRNPVLVRDPSTEAYSNVPVAVSELQIPALTYLVRPVDPVSQTGAVCGLGPDLLVDGRRIPTAVRGTVADVLSGRALRLVPCGPAELTLVAGEHRIQVVDSPSMSAQSLSLTSAGSTAGAVARGQHVVHWSAEHRVVRMGAGLATLLVVRENANPGWRATMQGRSLRAVTVDGWAQGWVVPAGAAGDVTLDFAPGQWLRWSLVVGALAVLVLIGLALAPDRAGPIARSAAVRRWPTWAGPVLLGLVGLALGGLLGVLAVVLAAAVARLHERAAVLVVAAVAATGAVVLAVARWRDWSVSDTVAVVDLVALVALGAVLGSGDSALGDTRRFITTFRAATSRLRA